MKSDLIDLRLHKHHATDRAILVSLTGDERKAVWLPLSAVEVMPLNNSTVEVSLPEGLAIDKGLV